MREKRFKLSSETVLQYQIMDNDTDLNEKEVVDKLNELSEEKEYFERKKEYFLSKWSIVNAKNIQLRQEIDDLKEENEQLRLELETHKHPLWSTREAERKVNKLADSLADEVKKNGLLNEEINQLRIENMRLKKKGGDGDMTKRFVLIEDDFEPLILDNKETMSVNEVVDVLNEQQDTINLLLDLLYQSEATVINEYSSHIGEDMDKLDKIFKEKDIKEIERFVRGCDDE